MQARRDDKIRPRYRRPNPTKNYSASLGVVANFIQNLYLSLTKVANLEGVVFVEGVDHSWGGDGG